MDEGFSSGNIKESDKFIDLEKLIASKNKRLLRLIPKFAMNWFKKLVHIDQINALLYKYRDVKGVDFAKCIVEKELGVKIVVNNPENIPTNSRALVVANHPIGSIDGMALMIAVGKTRNDILFPVNDMLCALPPFEGIFVPINKYGRNNSNHDILNEAFHSDSCVMFFPAGTESKYIDGVFQDFSWKKTFVKKAVEFERDVTPVYIEGINSKRFYRLSSIRRFFGIKFDLEMILLPDEMFKYKNKTITLTFGAPISYKEFGSDRTALEWANIMREHVYKLKNDIHVKFEPNVK